LAVGEEAVAVLSCQPQSSAVLVVRVRLELVTSINGKNEDK
jgi:hypothetical protein